VSLLAGSTEVPGGARLPSSEISHYRLLNALGSGGMGVVYRAEDTALGRTVALKFLSSHIAQDAKRVERFREEARTASALNHPNICTIYEVGEEQGETFIAMEYVEGRTLSEFVRMGGLPTETVLRYGRQICSALEHAHERGVVHRDLKPGNVMVTPAGTAKILDFGLAKRGDPAEIHRKTTDGSDTESSAGLTGTLPYMSPEQLEGRETGSRSDIWSVGVMLYEMVAGARPFRGDNLYRLCTAIIQEPMPALPPQVPAGLAAVIRKCLEKEPSQRYQRASELRAALETLETSSGHAQLQREWQRPKRRTGLWGGLAAAAILVAGVAIGFGWRYKHTGSVTSAAGFPERLQIAVLPPSGATAPEEVAFNDGLSETLTSRLTQLTQKHTLTVIPASEVRARKVTTVDAARAEFGVNLGLMLNVQHAGGQDRVNYSFVDASSHQQLRAGTITASTNDPFGLQDRVSESVVHALELELQPQEKKAWQAHGTTEPAAYDFYLQGRGYLQDYGKIENVESAITVFGRALEKDKGFAAAYAGLGEAYWRKFELMHEQPLVRQASESCQAAKQKNPSLSEADVCLGMVAQGTGRYEEAVAEFQKAAVAEPTLDSAATGLARAYESLNRMDDAEQAYKSAIALRPNYWAGYNRLGTFYLRQGKLDNAAEMYAQVISLAPDSFIGYSNLGITRVQQGKYAEAIEPLKRSVEIRKTGQATSNLATAYFQDKKYPEAAKYFEEATNLDPRNYELWGNLGDAYYWAPGLRERAPEVYRKAVALGEEQRKINPRDASMLSYLASDYAMLGKTAEANERISGALKQKPKDPEVLYYAGLVYAQAGEREKAITALQRAVAVGCPIAAIRDAPNFAPLADDSRYKALISTDK
jgi:eukaryotic-like serine/threonine-protein kinase